MRISWYVWFTRDPSTPEPHSAVWYGEHPKSKSKSTIIGGSDSSRPNGSLKSGTGGPSHAETRCLSQMWASLPCLEMAPLWQFACHLWFAPSLFAHHVPTCISWVFPMSLNHSCFSLKPGSCYSLQTIAFLLLKHIQSTFHTCHRPSSFSCWPLYTSHSAVCVGTDAIRCIEAPHSQPGSWSLTEGCNTPGDV